jgi:hypothetical protein
MLSYFTWILKKNQTTYEFNVILAQKYDKNIQKHMTWPILFLKKILQNSEVRLFLSDMNNAMTSEACLLM